MRINYQNDSVIIFYYNRGKRIIVKFILFYKQKYYFETQYQTYIASLQILLAHTKFLELEIGSLEMKMAYTWFGNSESNAMDIVSIWKRKAV